MTADTSAKIELVKQFAKLNIEIGAALEVGSHICKTYFCYKCPSRTYCKANPTVSLELTEAELIAIKLEVPELFI